jgi:hypothetical protein
LRWSELLADLLEEHALLRARSAIDVRRALHQCDRGLPLRIAKPTLAVREQVVEVLAQNLAVAEQMCARGQKL